MIKLLDVNVLVSLAWPNHVHHDVALAWFRNEQRKAWATTPITECGFVRVSSNRSAITTAVTPSEALALLARIRDIDGHVFLPDDLEWVVGLGDVEPARVLSHRMVTDAHLLELARRHGGRLVTFDRGIAALAGRNSKDVELLQAR